MYLGENQRSSAFSAGYSANDERGGASPSLLTGFHKLSIFIKAMDDESSLVFVVQSLSVFGFTVDSLLTHTPITQYLYPV